VVDWERWIGVRGAAAAGGTVLALAALLLFQYTIEHNLITRPMRVVLGVAAGLLCIGLSEWLSRRVQPFAANALTGAGIVALYASFWAGHSLYGLLGAVPAFLLLVLTTIACGALARHRGSLLVAVLGLVGGFATPLLVTPGIDQPLTLFSYVLLLDGGLLWLARERAWPVLAALSVAGTALHQALWVLSSTQDDLLPIGTVVLAVFALGFAAATSGPTAALWRWTTVGGTTVAYGLALVLAIRAAAGSDIAALGALLILLSALAAWIARRLASAQVALGAAAATLGIITAWLLVQHPSPDTLWEVVGFAVAACAVFHLGWELERTSDRAYLPQAALLAVGGLLVILIVAAWRRLETPLWPWLAGWCVAAALLIRQSSQAGRFRLQIAAWSALAVGLVGFASGTIGSTQAPGFTGLLMIGAAVALAARFATALWRAPATRRAAEASAAASALLLVLMPLLRTATDARASLPELSFAMLLGVLVAVAAARLCSATWLAVAVAATALSHFSWTIRWESAEGAPILAGLALQLAAVIVFTLWPARTRPAFADRPGAWRAAALAGPAWFLSTKWLYEARFPDAPVGLLPIGLGAIALLAAALVHRSRSESAPTRAAALVWSLAVALSFVSIAIPLQLHREWITIGWALNGLALITLWRRIDHPGLKYLGVALLAAATVRLVANPAVLSYAERGHWPILNWLLYTYLVPAGALLGAGALLAPVEVPRLRPREAEIQGQNPVLSQLCGVAAVAVVFVWINLAIADLFSTSRMLELSFERMPARDLTTSIAWTAYALCLLALGIRRESLGLRWLSLLLFLTTIAKVFLHDLGELRDLYRVASLTGLAVSLIVVSIVYQRYVLRRPPRRAPEGH
jgi:hypothetical protein